MMSTLGEKVGEMSLYSAIRAGPRGVIYKGGGGHLKLQA